MNNQTTNQTTLKEKEKEKSMIESVNANATTIQPTASGTQRKEYRSPIVESFLKSDFETVGENETKVLEFVKGLEKIVKSSTASLNLINCSIL